MKNAREIRNIMIEVAEKNKQKREQYENDQINKILKKYKLEISQLEKMIIEEAKKENIHFSISLDHDNLFSKMTYDEVLLIRKYLLSLEYDFEITNSVDGLFVTIDWYDRSHRY